MERDTVIFDLIKKECQRQKEGIELIASENFVSDEVMEAMGSCLTNKYAEGYPGARYYGGCQILTWDWIWLTEVTCLTDHLSTFQESTINRSLIM